NGGPATLPNGQANNVPNSDNDPFGLVCYYSVPSNDPAFSVTNKIYRADDQSTHEANSSYTGYTFTFNKNYSNRYQFVASYDIDLAHTVQNNPDTPNVTISNAR